MQRLVLLLGVILSTGVQGQTLDFYGLFPQYAQTGPITKRLSYNLLLSSTIDAFDRTIERKTYPATNLQIYVQPSLMYQISPTIQAGAGYAYVKHNLFGLHTHENRWWIQASHGQAINRWRMTHRLRYEQRYPLRQQQWSSAALVRYHVTVVRPLYDAKAQKHGFYLSAFNEAFFCLTGAQNGPISAKNAFYGEDWMYGGIGYNTGRWGRIETGYMFQDLIRNPQREHRHLHLLQVTWTTNLSIDDFMIWLITP